MLCGKVRLPVEEMYRQIKELYRPDLHLWRQRVHHRLAALHDGPPRGASHAVGERLAVVVQVVLFHGLRGRARGHP